MLIVHDLIEKTKFGVSVSMIMVILSRNSCRQWSLNFSNIPLRQGLPAKI